MSYWNYLSLWYLFRCKNHSVTESNILNLNIAELSSHKSFRARTLYCRKDIERDSLLPLVPPCISPTAISYFTYYFDQIFIKNKCATYVTMSLSLNNHASYITLLFVFDYLRSLLFTCIWQENKLTPASKKSSRKTFIDSLNTDEEYLF